MTTSKPRKSLWDASKREAYDKTVETTKKEFVEKREGEDIAKNLVEHFQRLGEEEAAFLCYLVLIDRRVVIALDEGNLFKKLQNAGFLQVPPGVGALFQRYNQTTYSVPIAIWNSLIKTENECLFRVHNDTEEKRQILTDRFSDRIDAAVKLEDGFIDLPKI